MRRREEGYGGNDVGKARATSRLCSITGQLLSKRDSGMRSPKIVGFMKLNSGIWDYQQYFFIIRIQKLQQIDSFSAFNSDSSVQSVSVFRKNNSDGRAHPNCSFGHCSCIFYSKLTQICPTFVSSGSHPETSSYPPLDCGLN